MLRRKSTLFISVLLITALSACNLPTGGATEENPVNDLALTVTAQALLLEQQGSSQQQPPAGQEAATATPEFTATPGPTSTPSVPQVTVSVNTNCRFGPGVVYGLIDSLLVGQTAEVVGKNSSVPNYWVIKRINGSGTCWLWGEYATVTGNTANLPEYPVPATPTPSPTPTFTPTPTPSAPAAAENAAVAKVCIPSAPAPLDVTYIYQGNLTWTDKSNNEDGFNIYFNGGLITALPANTTSFPLPPQVLPKAVPATWSVEAFNGAGKAAMVNAVFICP